MKLSRMRDLGRLPADVTAASSGVSSRISSFVAFAFLIELDHLIFFYYVVYISLFLISFFWLNKEI